MPLVFVNLMGRPHLLKAYNNDKKYEKLVKLEK
jgi:hypothetical protein